MEQSKQNTSSMKQRKFSNALLMLTAILWGSGFIPQRLGADNLTHFTFNGFRFLLAGITLLFLAKFKLPKDKPGIRITIISGLVLFIGSALQQMGMKTTTIGNTSFITTIYVVLVPFLSFILFRKPIKRNEYLAVIIALIGLYLISTSGKALDKISTGDGLVFLGSIFWAMHIILIGKASKITDPYQFSAGQFLVSTTLNLLCWNFIDQAPTENLVRLLPWIAYSGIFVIGAGFTLQALAQKHADSSQAAIILGLESVFGAVFGVLIFGEKFSLVQIFGAALIFVSVIIAVRSDAVPEVAEIEPRV